MIVAGLVLLLACTNLAGVQLARGVDRRREIAIKLALGASRRSLVRQLVTEAVVLALAAGIVGLAVASLSRMSIDINVDGLEPPEGLEGFRIDRSEADAGFFEAAGIRILRGRNFAASDNEDAARVAIVNEAFARRFWPGEDAVGRVFRRERSEAGPDPYEAVGIASNAAIRQPGEAPLPFIYLPFEQEYTTFGTIVARTSMDPEQTALQLLATTRELDPEAWILEAKTMDRHLAIVRLPARLGALLVSVFAAVASSLAVIGLYGMVSYAVSQRVREVGIRMSLGADVASVVRLLMGGGLKLIGIGALIGVPLAVAAARLLRGLLVGVEPFDPGIFLASAIGLVSVASLAAYLAARRASGIEPVVALRND